MTTWLDSVANGAILSEDGLYRYALWRQWEPPPPTPEEAMLVENILAKYPPSRPVVPPWVTFVMLNPSTADASKDDATIRKLRSFAKAWSYCRFVVVNVFAWRATDPDALDGVVDPRGPDNEFWLGRATSVADLVVCGWGNHAGDAGRFLAKQLRQWCRPHYLRLNKDGSPAHPLYLPLALEPKEWR